MSHSGEKDRPAYGFGLLRSTRSDAPDPIVSGGIDPDVEVVEAPPAPSPESGDGDSTEAGGGQ